MRTWMIAAALWAGAFTLVGVGAMHAPKGECSDENHDAYLVGSDRAGTFFAAATLLAAAATPFVVAGAFGARPRRGRIVFALSGVISLGATAFLAFVTLASLVFRCLE